MGNTFSFDRLKILIYKHAVENWKLYIISVIVMSIPIYISNVTRDYQKNLPLFSTCIYLMILTGGIYTGMFFAKWTDKVKGSTYFLLPATVYEKLALVFCYSVLFFVPVYTCVFYLESLLLTKIYYPGGEVLFMGLSGEHSYLFTFVSEAIVPYLFFQSLFLLLNIWLEKRQTIRAIIYLTFSFFAVTICNNMFIQLLSGNSGTIVCEKIVLFPVTVDYSGSGDYTLFTSSLIASISIPVIILLTVLIYMTAYFKLKEKEI